MKYSSRFSSIPPPNNNQHQQQKPPLLPTTDNSYTLLGFDYLSPPKDFAVVQRAYRNLARQYHPDVVVGPDATEEEREKANADFIRINEAYEDIKSRKDEEEIEVVIMGGNFDNGKRGKCMLYMLSLCLDTYEYAIQTKFSSNIYFIICIYNLRSKSKVQNV